jgi:hypothetical protein
VQNAQVFGHASDDGAGGIQVERLDAHRQEDLAVVGERLREAAPGSFPGLYQARAGQTLKGSGDDGGDVHRIALVLIAASGQSGRAGDLVDEENYFGVLGPQAEDLVEYGAPVAMRREAGQAGGGEAPHFLAHQLGRALALDQAPDHLVDHGRLAGPRRPYDDDPAFER